MDDAGLLERGDELATVRAIAGSGTGRLGLIEGPAGIGKTQLLGQAAAHARRDGVRILTARGLELEAELAWGGCVSLLQDAVAGLSASERNALLSGPGAPARALLGTSADDSPAPTPADVDLPVLHAVAWVIGGASGQQPVAVFVDDAHWLDEHSLRALHFLAARLDRLNAGMVLARRTGEPAVHTELLEALAALPRMELIALDPLGDEAVAAIVRESFAEADEALCAACARASGGNPLLLRQLLSALKTEPDAPSAARIDALAPVGLSRQVLVRLGRLGAGAIALARAVALLGDGASLAVAAALAGLDRAQAVRAAGALIRADLLADEAHLRFVHPLVRRAVDADRSAPERAAAHADAAAVLLEHGASDEAVAGQLLLAAPVGAPWAVTCLRAAAARALSQAAPESAIAYLERALQEPLEDEVRGEIVIALSSAESAAGRPPGPALNGALAAATDAHQRARMFGALGWSLHRAGRFGESASAFEEARTLAAGDPQLEAEMQAGHLATALVSVAHAPAAHEEARRLLDRSGSELAPAQCEVLAALLIHQLYVGAPRDPILAATRRLDVQRVIAEQSADAHTVWHLIGLLSWCDAPEVDSALEAAFADAQARASVLAFAMASYARSWPRLWAGRLADAAADAQAAVDAWAGGMEMYLPAAAHWACWAHLERADVAAARQALEAAGDLERWDESMQAFLLSARGRLGATLGDHRAALEAQLACGERLEKLSATNPSILSWRSEAARSAAVLGQRAQAIELAEQELDLARAFGAPRALGVALCAHGVLTDSEAQVGEAVELLDDDARRLEHVRALVELGAMQRRAGRRAEAREPLREALGRAAALGARRLEDVARAELLAAGARPRRVMRAGLDALTPSERRVAALAAAGSTNREIAGQLFITVSTVEWHLRQVYVKLGIASRRELSGHLS